MNIGIKIKELRAELGISQNELGQLLNVKQQVISYYEKGDDIDASKLATISSEYNIDIRYFFSDKPLSYFRETFLEPNSASGVIIPFGWDDLLGEISCLNHKQLKILEALVRTLIKEFTN
ncbi:helix-turn-helix domain-containing protein [Deferribacteres bacterium DY0037]|nr:helix-turn-helix transcriptional regulator [Denitrovibrio acetiphilus]